MKTIIASGGNLFQLALVHLGDATQWNRIAALNKLNDPMLEGLRTLKIPSVDASAGGGLAGQ